MQFQHFTQYKVALILYPFFFLFLHCRMETVIFWSILLTIIRGSMANKPEYLLKNNGDITFSEYEWTISINWGLQEYLRKALILERTVEKIHEVSNLTPTEPNCKYFEDNLIHQSDLIRREVDNLMRRKRSKRFIPVLIAVLWVPAIVLGVAYVIYNESRRHEEINELNNKFNEERGLLRDHINVTKLLIDTVIETRQGYYEVKRLLSSLNRTAEKAQTFNDLLNIADRQIIDFNYDTQRFMQILNNNYRSQFFSFVDINSFELKLEDARKKLAKTLYMLPTNSAQDILDLSTLSHSRNDTHIVTGSGYG